MKKQQSFLRVHLKTIADTLGMVVSVKPVDKSTLKEIYSRAKAEFTREAEREETKKNIISKFSTNARTIRICY